MKYVTQYGELYRMSDHNYLRMLRDGAAGTLETWEHYGAKKLATDVESLTDWEPRDFAAALRLEHKAPGARP